jgi:iron complex transport system substrate-binding protein
MTARTPLAHAATVAAVTVALLAGCASGGSGGSGGDEPAATTPRAGYPVTVGDLTLQAQPTRIVSLSPVATEMLFAVGAGGQVVAADEFSTYPPEAPTTGLSGFTPNVEAIAEHDPDLVVISYDPGDLVTQLDALAIPAHLVSDTPADLDDVYAQITDIGTLTGHPAEATDLVRRMDEDITKLAADVPPRDEPLSYYFEIDDTLYTFTSQTFVGFLFEMVGLTNIAGAEDPEAFTTQLSSEVVIDANPDLIFLADTRCCGQSAETVAARDGWADIAAVRDGHVVELDDDIASRWGPRVVDLFRAIVDAVSRVP